MNIQNLPNEILQYIFEYLDHQSLIKCSQVCKSWYSNANDPILWKKIFHHFHEYEPNISMKNAKELYFDRIRLIKNLTQENIKKKNLYLYVHYENYLCGMKYETSHYLQSGDQLFGVHKGFNKLYKYDLKSCSLVWEKEISSIHPESLKTIRNIDEKSFCLITKIPKDMKESDSLLETFSDCFDLVQIYRKKDGEMIKEIKGEFVLFKIWNGKVIYQIFDDDYLNIGFSKKIYSNYYQKKQDNIPLKRTHCINEFSYCHIHSNSNYIGVAYQTGNVNLINIKTGLIDKKFILENIGFTDFILNDQMCIFRQIGKNDFHVYHFLTSKRYRVPLESEFHYHIYRDKLICFTHNEENSQGKIYHLPDGKLIKEFDCPYQVECMSVKTLFFKERLLVFFKYKNELWIWNTDGKVLNQLKGNFRFVSDINHSKFIDNRYNICVIEELNQLGHPKKFIFLDLNTGKIIREREVHKDNLYKRFYYNDWMIIGCTREMEYLHRNELDEKKQIYTRKNIIWNFNSKHSNHEEREESEGFFIQNPVINAG